LICFWVRGLGCLLELREKANEINHRKNSTDWRAFAVEAVGLLREAGKVFYVKDDLRVFLPAGFLTPAESDCETVFLPDRPGSDLFA